MCWSKYIKQSRDLVHKAKKAEQIKVNFQSSINSCVFISPSIQIQTFQKVKMFKVIVFFVAVGLTVGQAPGQCENACVSQNARNGALYKQLFQGSISQVDYTSVCKYVLKLYVKTKIYLQDKIRYLGNRSI